MAYRERKEDEIIYWWKLNVENGVRVYLIHLYILSVEEISTISQDHIT